MDILITEDLASPHIDALAGKFHVVREPGLWKDAAALRERIREARTLMVRNQTQLTAEILASAPNLIGIGRIGVGLDNIDVKAASERGIVVVAPLEANAISVAELTIGLMLALARKIAFADRSTKAGGWDRRGCTGVELSGKTLAIVGFGRIGRLVAARVRAFHMQVAVYDPYLTAEKAGITDSGVAFHPNLEDALAQADFVTVHLPLTPETKHLFGAKKFAATKPGAYFINTSRGGVVDEAALLGALRSGQLAGAALDVRATEPPVEPGPLAALDNVILLPHVGAFTHEAQVRTFEAVCTDLGRVLSGKPAFNAVNFPTPRRTQG
ncbi:MAG TPA: hydroxyacid dehydrogenase [Verrucomicrobiae bacterium]|jgi:D-3-phosphoglycerate dehydrogenase